MFSMYRAALNYEDVVTHDKRLLEHLGKTMDSFGWITFKRKPFSVIPPKTIHDEIIEPFVPYLIHQEIAVKEWPGNRQYLDMHRIMNVYRCCKETRALLAGVEGNLFYASGVDRTRSMPDDIFFNRGNDAMFVSTCHESVICYDATEKDLEALDRIGIRFNARKYDGGRFYSWKDLPSR